MFSPVTPILSADASDETTAHVLARVEAIHTVLAALARIAAVAAGPDLHGLARQAELAAALTDLGPGQLAHITRELDAIAAALMAGFVAIEKARSRGHSAKPAARLLYAEAREAFAATLVGATGSPASA